MAYDEMTTHVPRAVLIGNGSRGPFTLNDSSGNPIRVRTHSHLVVRRYTSVTDETGTALALNTDYTVSNTDVDVVTITLTSAQAVLASTERLVVTRLQSLADVISLSTGGNFSAETLSAAMSVLTEQLQEVRRDVDRSIKPSWRNTATPSLPIAPSATKFLAHTSDDELTHVEIADISPTGVTLGTGWATAVSAPIGSGWTDTLADSSPLQIVADLKESNTAAQNKTALQAALDAAVATQKTLPGLMDWNRWKMPVIIPPGQYSINGAIDVVESLYLMALVPGTVTLVTANSTYTLIQTAGNAARNQYVKGINFVGGKGAYQSLNTGISVQGFRVFEDCKFDNYTECAVSGEEVDAPYWKFVRCMFYGAAAGNTIGIAIGGYLDSSAIIDCEFLHNKYHLKLGPRLSGSISVRGCGFFMYASGIRTADIWIVPNNTDAAGVNAGQGILIDNNKFGSENMLAGDVRVLIADEGSGTYRADKHHSTTYNTSGYVAGINWTNNRISSVGSNTGPFIKSYVDNIWNMTFAKTNVVDGQYAYLCEFVTVQTNDEGYVEYTWNVDVPPTYGMVAPFTSGISNRPIGVVEDWYQLQADAEVVVAGSGGDDAEYVNLGSFIGNADLTVTGSATKATTPDLYGTARASEVTAASASNSGVFGLVSSIAISTLTRASNVVTADCAADHGLQVGQFVTIASATGDTSLNGEYTVASVVDSNSFTYASTGSNGSATGSPVLYKFEPRKLTWLEVDVARGLTNSVGTVDIRVINFLSGILATRRIVRLPSTWRTLRIPFVWPDTTQPTGWLVQVSAADFTTTTAIKFRCGRVRMYHGRQPMNHNHVRTGGNGAWDGEHIVLGAYHLWIDSTGDFRIKSSAPTSDTDGTVVGTQS